MTVTRHTVEYLIQQTWSRVGALAWTYTEIAQESLDRFLLERVNPILRPGREADPTLYFDHEKRISVAAIQTIVFSGMALEAAAYDLAAIHLDDAYASNYLDKLDLVSKWVVIPSLICGKSLNANGPAINALRTLVRARNSLVHHKSQPARLDVAQIENSEKRSAQLLQDASTAFRAVVLLSLELNCVFNGPVGVLPFFEVNCVKQAVLPPKYSVNLTHFIERCRDVHANSQS